MSRFLGIIESWMRRRGVLIPRAYLLGVLSLLGGLLCVLGIPSCREYLATVILHDYFLVCMVAIAGPLLLCDPVRGRNEMWAAFHLACLAASGLLAFFFLTFCDLLARDDRVFLFLLSCFASVLIGRLFIAELLISWAAKSIASSESGRVQMLSAYARLLDVDPARVGLSPPVLSHRLLLSVRERFLRILGLRRTRSPAVEESFRNVVDALASEVAASPSLDAIGRYASALRHEMMLHRVILATRHVGEIHSRDISELWPVAFYNRWSSLMTGHQRVLSRTRGTPEEALAQEFRTQVLVSILTEARDIMMIVYPDDKAGSDRLNDAIVAFKADGRILAHELRRKFDHSVQDLRRGRNSNTTRLAFMGLSLSAAEKIPADFLAVYGLANAGKAEWDKTGLPALFLAVCLTIATRRQLEAGGLTESQSAPVFARLLGESAKAGFSVQDYPESGWGVLMRSTSLQWANFAEGVSPCGLEEMVRLAEQDEPGVGRISVANAFVFGALASVMVLFTATSPFWISKHKEFRDVFGPYLRAHPKATSVDLSSAGDQVAIATADQGLLTIDPRNYSVRQIGVPDGLSSNQLSDVVALEGQSYVIATEGLYGAKGADYLRDGTIAPLIGLSEHDHSALTSESPLTMVNVGRDALFVFKKGLLFYDAKRRVLVAVAGAPSDILGACGSKRVEGRAWVLSSESGRNVVSEVVRDPLGRFIFNPVATGSPLNPSKIFHDGDSLWCIDRDQSGVFVLKDSKWSLRAGSPREARESGGVSSAEALAVSRLPAASKSDVLWMVKSGKIFSRRIPHDPLQAELPEPWDSAVSLEKDYLGEVHGFSVDDIGYLVVPYEDRIVLLSHRGTYPVTPTLMQLPKAGSRLRSIDVASGKAIIASSEALRSQVHLMDLRTFVGLAAGQTRAEWPTPVQSSAFLSENFLLDDVVGVCKIGQQTYHFDSHGRWLKHDSVSHGLVNSGQEAVPVVETPSLRDRLKSLQLRSVSQSADGAKALLASNFGLHEVSLGTLGSPGAEVKAIVSEAVSTPPAASRPFGISDTNVGPELYFLEAKGEAQADDVRRLAQVWRLKDHLTLGSSWVSQTISPGSNKVFADSITRVRSDRPDGTVFFGAPVAITDGWGLVVRDLTDDVWRPSGSSGRWTQLAHSADGGTVVRQLGGDKSDGDVLRISQLLPSGKGITERPLWAGAVSAPKGELVSPSAVVAVNGRGLVFPTKDGFWAYRPLSRSWDRLMSHGPAAVDSYRILSDSIRHPSGSSVISWWADNASHVYGVNESKALTFEQVGGVASGSASGDVFAALNDTNGLFVFDLARGSTKRVFAPIANPGYRSGVGAIEQGERGLAFLPSGGGRVMTIDQDDQFEADKGPVFRSIATVGGRLVGLREVDGVARLSAVYSPTITVGSELESLHSLGDMAIAMSSSGTVWMSGFSGGSLYGRIIGDSKASVAAPLPAKVNAAASVDGQLFLSAEGGIHYRTDDPAADEVPGFRRIAWSKADWFRVVEGLGKAAPYGGLGCYSLGENVDFALITRGEKGEFRINNGMDLPIFGPGAGALSVFKQGAAGKIVPYDDTARIIYGGGTSLGRNAKVHPMDGGLIVLSRSNGAGIAYYDPLLGSDALLGFVRAEDGTRIGCPFGSDVDFIYPSASPDVMPFLRDGRILGRLSRTHADVEVLSEYAKSPVVQSGRLRWIVGQQLMGASSEGGGVITKEDLPAISRSAPGVITGVLSAGAAEKLFMIVDGNLVEADLNADKFRNVRSADIIFPFGDGVLAASRRGDGSWILSDGNVALPSFIKDLGPVGIAASGNYLAVYNPLVDGRYFKAKALSVTGTGAGLTYSARIVPRLELSLAVGSTLQRGRRVFHVEHGKVFSYDIDKGEWAEPDLPAGFEVSSVRKHKDGAFYFVDDKSTDAVLVPADSRPLGEVQKAKAYGPSLDGALLGVRPDRSGAPGLYAGQKKLVSEIDAWRRHDIAFTDKTISFAGPSGLCSLLIDSPSAKNISVYVRRGGKLTRTDLELPAPFATLSVCEVHDGFVITDMRDFVQRIGVSADGDVYMSVMPFDYAHLGKFIMPSRSPAGWTKVAGRYYHKSGYEEGAVIKLDAPVRLNDSRLRVTVRKVTFGGDAEQTEEIPVDCGDSPRFSLVHPEFEKIGSRDSVAFEKGYFHADFSGTRVPVLPQRVVADAAAPIDHVRQLAVLGMTALCQMDGQGGAWMRDTNTGVRRFAGRVSADAAFLLARRGDEGEIGVVLESGGVRRMVAPDAGLTPVVGTGWQFSQTIHGFSRRIDKLKATPGPAGFGLTLSGRFAISSSLDGWTIGAPSSEPKLQVSSDGTLVLEFATSDSPSRAFVHVPATGMRRILSARLIDAADFKKETKVPLVRIGGYSFDMSSGSLKVTCQGLESPIGLSPGGGLESDHHSRAVSIGDSSRKYLVSVSGLSGRVFLRGWESGRLGPLREIVMPPASPRPDLAVSVDGVGFLRCGTTWYELKVDESAAVAIKHGKSPVAGWGEVPRDAGLKWSLESGKIFSSAGAGWEEVPCRADPLAFAFDLPAPLFEDYRFVSPGRIIFKSRLTEKGRPLWYSVGKEGGIPRRFGSALPDPYVPPAKMVASDSLGNEMTFDRNRPQDYRLSIRSGGEASISLGISAGSRLPHLGEFSSPVSSGGAIYFEAGKTSLQQQLYLKVPDDGSAPSLTQAGAAMNAAAAAADSRQWWIKEGLVSLEWDASRGLVMGVKNPDGSSVFAILGSYSDGRAWDADDPSQVILRDVRTMTFSFSPKRSASTVIVMPAEGYGSLANVLRLESLPDEYAGRDVFKESREYSNEEMRPIDSLSGSHDPARFSCSLLTDARIEVRPGLEIPLHVSRQLGGWTTPQGDVVSGLRLADGRLLLQSGGGVWLSYYSPAGELLSGRFVELPDSARLRWSQPGRDSPSIEIDAGSVALSLPDLSDGAAVTAGEAYPVEGGLSVSRRESSMFAFELDGFSVERNRYPSTDITSVSLAGDIVTLEDSYGIRSLLAGSFSKVIKGDAVRHSLGTPAPVGGPVVEGACGAWNLARRDGRFEVTRESRSLLDAQGAPYVDSIADFDGYEGHLIFNHDERLVLLASSVVHDAIPWGAGVGMVDRAKVRAPRLAISNLDSSMVVDFGNEGGVSYHISNRSIVANIPSRRPLGVLFGSAKEFYANETDRFELRIKLGANDVGPRVVSYLGKDVFWGNQLVSDHVSSIKTAEGSLFIRHPISTNDPAGWLEHLQEVWGSKMTPVRDRDGPSSSVDVPASLLRPWSEPRAWGIGKEGIIWDELGVRWGD